MAGAEVGISRSGQPLVQGGEGRKKVLEVEDYGNTKEMCVIKRDHRDCSNNDMVLKDSAIQ